MMKFEFAKKGKIASLRIHEVGKPVRERLVAIDSRVYVKSKAPAREDLKNTMELQCELDSLKKSEFLSSYQKSMRERIEEETNKIMQSYMRIQAAMNCIDVAEEIELSDGL